VADLIADTDNWSLRYLVVDTQSPLSTEKVLIPPDWITEVQWETAMVRTDRLSRQIARSPAYRPEDAVNRDHEARPYDYYGRPACGHRS
jgi:hypothetical protein